MSQALFYMEVYYKILEDTENFRILRLETKEGRLIGEIRCEVGDNILLLVETVYPDLNFEQLIAR